MSWFLVLVDWARYRTDEEAIASFDTTNRYTPVVLFTEYSSMTASSSHYSSHYEPYLRDAINRQQTIPFDDFLTSILRHSLSSNSAHIAIVSDNHFQTLLAKYRERVALRQKTEHHSSFVELANHVINQLDTHSSDPDPRIQFFCDHAHAPDVAVVLNKNLEVPGRGGVENLTEHGSKQVLFDWSELLCFFELELGHKCPDPQDTVTGDHSSSTFILIFHFLRLKVSGSVGV